MTEEKIKTFLTRAVESLKSLDPVMILLFGSTAKDDTNEYSDIDFLIVLNSNHIPQSYEEKMELKMKVRKSLGDLNKKIPIDILVYTIPEYEELKKINSSFYREIHQSGKVVYEKAG